MFGLSDSLPRGDTAHEGGELAGHGGVQGHLAASPFLQHPLTQLVMAPAQQHVLVQGGLPTAAAPGSGGVVGTGSYDPALLCSGFTSGSTASTTDGSGYVYGLAEQPSQLLPGQSSLLAGQSVAYQQYVPEAQPVLASSAALPILQQPLVMGMPDTQQYFQQQQHAHLQQQQQLQQQQAAAAAAAVAAASTGKSGGGSKPAGKAKTKRVYKRQDQIQLERRQKDQAQELIRRMEKELGQAKKDLESLQAENKALHRKAVVLSKHSSFRRCAAAMAEELTQSMTLGEQLHNIDWRQQHGMQRVLDAAQKGLPGPDLLDYLRQMTVDDAVQFYNSVVARVRLLLHQVDHGPDRAAALQQLDDIFTLKDKASTFGYLQVVNPSVYVQLTQAKLDPASPVDRQDPSHWRSVLSSMLLSEEQQAQLILLLQSHLQQAEQIVKRKSEVIQQLADELSSNLRSLELERHPSMDLSSPQLISDGSNGSADLAGFTSSLSNSSSQEIEGQEGGGGGGDPTREGSAGAGPLQSKDELDNLVQLEYWLKFDFIGCVRKLLPPQQQALCMVASWPFYPDARQLEEAIKQKAGQMWEQLQNSGA